MEFDFENDFNFDLNFAGCEFEKEQEIAFVAKHAASEKVFDFTKSESLNEIMRFEIVRSLNFEIPNLGESLFLATTKAISLLDVVNYIEQEKGLISEAFIFFYTLNDKAANYTCNLAGRSKVNIVISDLMNSKREKERVITKIFDSNNVDICFCHNHSKIASFKIGDNFYTLTGSMNAGNNARIETLQIINNEKMYNFVAELFHELKTKFLINKRY